MRLLQAIDMIMNLYENQFPMRFGVILYSTTFIESLEKNGDEINASSSASAVEEDISSMVKFILYFFLRMNSILHVICDLFAFISFNSSAS